MAGYHLNEEKMFSDIADGVAIIINSETGIYYGLNELGTVVFEKLTAGIPPATCAAALQALAGAPEDMTARIEAFVKALCAYGIIIPGTEQDVSVSFDAATAEGSNFELTVQEYNDAQELLLADPIHEVKPEDGWQPSKSVLETDSAVVAAREAKMER